MSQTTLTQQINAESCPQAPTHGSPRQFARPGWPAVGAHGGAGRDIQEQPSAAMCQTGEDKTLKAELGGGGVRGVLTETYFRGLGKAPLTLVLI